MAARRLRETADTGRTTRVQSPCHSDIDADYLSALQRQVDAAKPKGFALTPIRSPA